MKFLDYREQRPGQFVRNRPARIGCNLTRKIGVAATPRAGCRAGPLSLAAEAMLPMVSMILTMVSITPQFSLNRNLIRAVRCVGGCASQPKRQ